jgi:hypothetical protein
VVVGLRLCMVLVGSVSTECKSPVYGFCCFDSHLRACEYA